MRELWGNVLHTSGAKIYSLLVGIIVLFITARWLGPEGRGQVAAIHTWVSLFATLAFLSLGQVALHRMAQDPHHKQFGGLLGSLLLLAAVLTLIGWLVALGMIFFGLSSVFGGLPTSLLLVGFLALPFMIWEHYGSSLLMGLDRVRVYNRYQVAGRTLTVVLVLVLVGGIGSGVLGALEATLLGNVVVAAGGIKILAAQVQLSNSRLRADRAEIRNLLSGGAKLHLNAVGTFLFSSVNVLILNHYQAAEQVGQFQMANQLIAILMIIPQAAGMVIYGKVVRQGPDKAWPEHKRLLIQTTVLIVGLSALAALLSPWAIPFVAGEAFRPAVAPFQWMLLGLVGMNFSTLMGPQWIARGYFWQAAILTFLVGCINLAVNFWLIPTHGMQGAVTAFLGTYFFSVVGNGAMAVHCDRRARASGHSLVGPGANPTPDLAVSKPNSP